MGTSWFGDLDGYSDEECDAMDDGDHEDMQAEVQSASNMLSVAETYATQVVFHSTYEFQPNLIRPCNNNKLSRFPLSCSWPAPALGPTVAAAA